MGKTTCAAAVAVGLAEAGTRVLVVSTDPAHSLGDALGTRLGAEPSRVETRSGELLAAELDAGQALERWLGARRSNLEQLVERGTFLDHEDVERILDLSLPGVDELISLIELLRLARESACEEVVVDTAPTAHTVRLLAMPGELRRFAGALDRFQSKHRLLADRFGRGHVPDGADALIEEISGQAADIQTILRDPARARIRWVLLPEALALAETRDGVGTLEEAGLPVRELIVNRVTPPPDAPCLLCEAKRRAEREVIEELQGYFPGWVIHFLGAREEEPRRLPALREIARELARGGRAMDEGPELKDSRAHGRRKRRSQGQPAGLNAILPPSPRLLFFGGKGGVGKTTCATAATLALSARRPASRMLLLSTDPAHSLADLLEIPLGDDERPVPQGPPGLRVRELDPARTFEEWRQRYWRHGPALAEEIGSLAEAGSGVEAEDFREILQLAPPGLAEMSAVSALIDALFGTADRPPYDLIVVDTAPTGHALQLLEMPELMMEWVHTLLSLLLKYREALGLGRLATELLELSKRLRQLGEVLRDPDQTRFITVTRAASSPAGRPSACSKPWRDWASRLPSVIIDAVTPPGCSVCRRARESEERHIQWLEKDCQREGKSNRCDIILAPAVFPPPRGAGGLAEWARTWKKRSE